MARIRTIKPEFWKHEELSALPEATHMLAAALLNYADDEGYFNANPRLIQSECCPLREPSVSIPESLRMLSEAGYVRLGNGADGKRYGFIAHFADHQRVSHPTASKIKDMDIVWEDSVRPHGALPNDSVLKGKERKGREEERNTPPSQASGGASAEGLRRYPEEFEAVWEEYRPIASPNATKADAARAFARLSKPDKAACWTGVVRYVQWVVDERTRRPDAPVQHLSTFINRRGWERFLEEVAA